LNRYARFIGQRSFNSKIIVQTTDRHTLIGPIALLGPLSGRQQCSTGWVFPALHKAVRCVQPFWSATSNRWTELLQHTKQDISVSSITSTVALLNHLNGQHLYGVTKKSKAASDEY